MRMKRFLVGFWLLMALQVLAGPNVARANTVLKPKGQSGVELRIKRIEGRVQIRGGFAATTSVMTFANETSQLIEADFLSTLPEGAVATYFAYWFGEEKVVARIVEKARAAEIYRSITAPRGDPALVEMIGKNTFRARIFPVMPNADLRVEMRWVQPLDSTPTGLEYRFPLAPEAKGKGVLDAIDLQIAVDSDAGIVRAGNNYHQPIAREDGRLSVKLQQQNFQPTADFVLNLEQRAATTPPPTLCAQLFAAPSGGSDGFFALALTANRDVKTPQLRIRGVPTYDLAPAKLPPLKAGEATTICGRYKSSGTGAIEVAGVGVAYVDFGARAENNNLATRLWAAQRLEDLSANEKNFETVLALSSQFGLPSKWSSWLAVPKTEMERFQWVKLQTDLNSLGHRYVDEVARNGAQSPAVGRLKTQFEALSRQLRERGYTNSLANYAQDQLRDYEQEQAAEKAKVKPNARRLAQLDTQIGRVQTLLTEAQRAEIAASLREQRLLGRMEEWSAQLLNEKLAGRGGARRAVQLRGALERSGKSFHYERNWDYLYNNREYNKAYTLARDYVRNLYEDRDAKATAHAAAQLRNLIGRDAAHKSLGEARREWASRQIDERAVKLAQEQTRVAPRADNVNSLQTQIARLGAQGGFDPRSLRQQVQARWAYSQLDTLYAQLAAARYVDDNATRVAKLSADIERVLPLASRAKPDDYEAYALLRLMFQSKQRYDAQLNSKTPDPKKLRTLEAQMAKIYADPKYQGIHKDYTAPNLAEIDKTRNPLQLPKIVELRTDYHNLDAQLRAAPNAAQRAQLEKQRAEKAAKLSYATRYHLRLGDPLIAIDAPRDALQVVAVMPDGQLKRLAWNDAAGRWEARFDIPSYASEGAYEIRVIVVEKDGARHENTVRYNVDMKAPHGAGAANLSAGDGQKLHQTLRLEIAGDRDTARVFAIFGAQKIELKLSPTGEQRFFALAKIAAGASAPAKVTYILTDLAHNRRSIEVDVAR